jgi:hypothetical protein
MTSKMIFYPIIIVIIYFISYPELIPGLTNIRENQFTSIWGSIFFNTTDTPGNTKEYKTLQFWRNTYLG